MQKMLILCLMFTTIPIIGMKKHNKHYVPKTYKSPQPKSRRNRTSPQIVSKNICPNEPEEFQNKQIKNNNLKSQEADQIFWEKMKEFVETNKSDTERNIYSKTKFYLSDEEKIIEKFIHLPTGKYTFNPASITAILDSLVSHSSPKSTNTILLCCRSGVYKKLSELSDYKQTLFCQQKYHQISKQDVPTLCDTVKPTIQIETNDKTVVIKHNGLSSSFSLNDSIAQYCVNKNNDKLAIITNTGLLFIFDLSNKDTPKLSRYCNTNGEVSSAQKISFHKNGESIIAQDKNGSWWEIGHYVHMNPTAYLVLSILKNNLSDGVLVVNSFGNIYTKQQEKTWLYAHYKEIQKNLEDSKYPYKIRCYEHVKAKCSLFKLEA